MCGIGGLIGFEGDTRAALARMNAAMAHRGPDDEGLFIDGEVGLCHRRLSIIDLGGGKQPMHTADGALTVVFNGEIYNYRELRDDLRALGHVFTSDSDTEVLLLGYRQWGDDVVDRLNGMFAFALYDRARARVLLARDHLGIKPLHIATLAHGFAFASELNTLRAVPQIAAQLTADYESLQHYMALFYIPDPLTIYRQVRTLPPAHLAVIESGRLKIERYWRIPAVQPSGHLHYEDAVEQLDNLLRASVKRQMVADVPLGAFLSGGTDSASVVAHMAALGGRVRTFTVGFAERDHDERETARAVADVLRTEHRDLEAGLNARELIDDLLPRFGEPFADSSALPTFLVSKATREQVTVALSGDGGDELFSGYLRYDTPERRRWLARIPALLRTPVLTALADALPESLRGVNFMRGAALDPVRYALLEIGEFRARQLLSDQALALGGRVDTWRKLLTDSDAPPWLEPRTRMQWIDAHSYLPGDILTKVDRMSMAVSLETRVPILDKDIVAFAFSLPQNFCLRGGRRKAILKDALERTIPRELIDRPKKGFSVPLAAWFRGELRGLLEDELSASAIREAGLLRERDVARLLREHLSGYRNHHSRLWQLLVLNRWWRTTRPGT